MTGSAPTADLTGWVGGPFTGAGLTHDVYEKGAGPGVVLLAEIPGVTPETLALGDHLVGAGFTVAIVSPFGTVGRPLSAGYVANTFARVCIASEFRAFALGAHRPFADYVRALARDLNGRTPGPGVGVIGMCFTGGFALAAAVDDAVLASVMSQPSLPMPIGAARRSDPGLSPDELATVTARTAASDLCVLGLRFSADRAATADRFATLRHHLGEAFEVIELDSAKGNLAGFSSTAHSVLTGEVRLNPPNPAADARAKATAFLKRRLSDH